MSASSSPTDSRHRRLADAAFAGGDGVDPGQRPRLGERDDRLAGVTAQLLTQFGALLVVHHVEADLDRSGARHVGDGLADPVADFGLLRAGGGGQVDLDVHIAAGAQLDTFDHPEFGNGAA
jgi:hypothetical protein